MLSRKINNFFRLENGALNLVKKFKTIFSSLLHCIPNIDDMKTICFHDPDVVNVTVKLSSLF